MLFRGLQHSLSLRVCNKHLYFFMGAFVCDKIPFKCSHFILPSVQRRIAPFLRTTKMSCPRFSFFFSEKNGFSGAALKFIMQNSFPHKSSPKRFIFHQTAVSFIGIQPWKSMINLSSSKNRLQSQDNSVSMGLQHQKKSGRGFNLIFLFEYQIPSPLFHIQISHKRTYYSCNPPTVFEGILFLSSVYMAQSLHEVLTIHENIFIPCLCFFFLTAPSRG